MIKKSRRSILAGVFVDNRAVDISDGSGLPAHRNDLPEHISEAKVFITHPSGRPTSTPIMLAKWHTEFWMFRWQDDPPTWVSWFKIGPSEEWILEHERWHKGALPDEMANLYHQRAFPPKGQP